MNQSYFTPKLRKIPIFLFSILLTGLVLSCSSVRENKKYTINTSWKHPSVISQPLVMEGGDPYIRALMRTISAAESNLPQPYNVLYSGKYVKSLEKHPQKCVPIKWGPNRGNCTTAAGRYQFLDFTWEEKARQYHPKSQFIWQDYSFEAEYQDIVVYRWLSDSQAWGMNLAFELQKGNLDKVLQRLSGTWTSLGYGIESNSISPYLPEIYQNILQEELS